MLRVLDNEHVTVAMSLVREPGKFWVSPFVLALKDKVEGALAVFSLLVLWGWDKETPFHIPPKYRLQSRWTGSQTKMLDMTLTVSCCGFCLVLHHCAETPCRTT